jgi:hypothetical protein
LLYQAPADFASRVTVRMHTPQDPEYVVLPFRDSMLVTNEGHLSSDMIGRYQKVQNGLNQGTRKCLLLNSLL